MGSRTGTATSFDEPRESVRLAGRADRRVLVGNQFQSSGNVTSGTAIRLLFEQSRVICTFASSWGEVGVTRIMTTVGDTPYSASVSSRYLRQHDRKIIDQPPHRRQKTRTIWNQRRYARVRGHPFPQYRPQCAGLQFSLTDITWERRNPDVRTCGFLQRNHAV